MTSSEKECASDLALPKRRRQILSYVLSIILLGIAVQYISGHGERFRQLLSISPYWLLVLAPVVVSNLGLRSWYLRELVRELGETISARECFYLLGATQMLDVFTLPAAGVVYRAIHLERNWRVSFVSYAAGMVVLTLARLLVWGLPAIGCTVWFAMLGKDVLTSAAFLLLALLIGLAVAGTSQMVLRSVAASRATQFGRVAEQYIRVTSSTRVRISALVVMLGCLVAQVLGFYLIFRSAGLSVDLISSTMIAALHQLSGIIGLTPGGLGIQEAVSLLFSTILGIAVADMLIVLALMRAGRMLLAVAIGGPCWCLLPQRNRKQCPPIPKSPNTER